MRVGKRPATHAPGQDAITVIRRVLEKCPDEYPPPTTTKLSFIQDRELRESIRNDVGAAGRAVNNAEWRAATVLAGATIEALLLWKLREQDRDQPDSDLDRWTLHQYIEEAARLELIKEDTAKAAKLAQNFRNLIHPGRAARLGQKCDRGTAHSTFGALHHVIDDLTPLQ
jgi:hypothetical protein